MARRKRRSYRRAASPRRIRRSRSSPLRISRRRSSRGGSLKMIQPDAMVYGGVRQIISNKLAGITAKIPLAQGADELVMAGVNWAAYKYIPNRMVKNVALKGLVIENARAGQLIANKVMGGVVNSGGVQYQIYG